MKGDCVTQGVLRGRESYTNADRLVIATYLMHRVTQALGLIKKDHRMFLLHPYFTITMLSDYGERAIRIRRIINNMRTIRSLWHSQLHQVLKQLY